MDTTNTLLVVVIGILIFQQLRLASFANDWTREILQLSVIRNQLQDMRVATKMESGMGFEEALRTFPEKTRSSGGMNCKKDALTPVQILRTS